MRLYLFDDEAADGWHPFALTRPVSELLYGALRLRERAERLAGREAEGTVVAGRPWLWAYAEPGAPPALSPDEAARGEGDRLYLLSRFVPEGSRTPELPDVPAALMAGGEVAGAWLPAGSPPPDPGWLARPDPGVGPETVEVEGELPEHPWELVEGNPRRTARDLSGGLAPSAGGGAGAGAAEGGGEPRLPPGAHRIGDGPLRMGPGARVEPGAVVDTREGPVVLGREVQVRAGSRLEGPLYLGPHGKVLGGAVGRSSAGPYAYLHGEVEESVVLGYANKSHSGFLGHSYLGRWVNLGALTTNSDLKNNYGPVRMAGPEGERDTGLLKLGVLVGDHAKTGIGTLLTCGGVVGAGANFYGGGTAPKWLPPFSWGDREGRVRYRKADFLQTAERVMGRRGVAFDDATRAWLEAAWEEAAGR